MLNYKVVFCLAKFFQNLKFLISTRFWALRLVKQVDNNLKWALKVRCNKRFLNRVDEKNLRPKLGENSKFGCGDCSWSI